MNNTQDAPALSEIRELSAEELLIVAGGPQVTNDTDPPAPPPSDNP